MESTLSLLPLNLLNRLEKDEMRKTLLACATALALIVHTGAQAQGFGAIGTALGGFMNGYQQGAIRDQELEAMRLHNELLRMQIESAARAEAQARNDAYSPTMAQQQGRDLAPISPGVNWLLYKPVQGAVPDPRREQPAVACPYYVSPGVCGSR